MWLGAWDRSVLFCLPKVLLALHMGSGWDLLPAE